MAPTCCYHKHQRGNQNFSITDVAIRLLLTARQHNFQQQD
jgi:hypothetical protein